ncbi:cytochrome B [Izhakiella australiensis]|uniref:Cytochrome B n=1 Tax=Izhakiella australiensis TaxID=1926881 RepID=A0A1S8YM59_9GAMM|nr:cytochrome b/b6 domain-containing protein [Izhakiella australiensis]OON40221.1 cytochrome B [Izhakiella australiensis]
MSKLTAQVQQNVHPLWLRLCHWLNAFAVLMMVMSGWQIYNASPLFNFSFAKSVTLGGWLGGALQWHFAAMWLFGVNGVVYLAINILSGRLRRRFWPLSLRQLYRDLAAALRGRLKHNDLRHYNMVQKTAYLLIMLDGLLLVLSGLVLWKSVQFPLLRTLLGGYETARYLHFTAMTLMVVFVLVHLLMVALVPRTLLIMLRGR